MAPYVMWKEKGYKVTLASIKGGKIPIDPGSLSDDFVTDKVKQFQSESAPNPSRHAPCAHCAR